MQEPKKRGSKRVRFALLGAVAAMATMAFGTSSAQAQTIPFTTTLDNAYLKVGGLPGSGLDILDPASPAEQAILSGEINPLTGDFTLPAAGFMFPDFAGEDVIPGVDIAVHLEALEPVTGNLEGGAAAATGKVTTDPSDFLATISIATAASDDACTIGDDPGTVADEEDLVFAFSTEADYPAPFKGDRFTFTTTPPAGQGPLQDGAVVTTWPTLPTATPAPGDDCSLIDGLTAGRGGLWMADGLAEPTPTTAPPPPPGPPAEPGVQRNPNAYKVCVKKANKKFKNAAKKAKKIKKKAVKKKKIRNAKKKKNKTIKKCKNQFL